MAKAELQRDQRLSAPLHSVRRWLQWKVSVVFPALLVLALAILALNDVRYKAEIQQLQMLTRHFQQSAQQYQQNAEQNFQRAEHFEQENKDCRAQLGPSRNGKK